MIATFVRRFGVFPVVWPGTGRRQPIHADDVALAMAAAASVPAAPGALFDLPGGDTLTYREMVCRIFESSGRRPILLYLPLGLARAAFYVWRTVTGAKYSAASLERMNMDLTLDPAPARKALGSPAGISPRASRTTNPTVNLPPPIDMEKASVAERTNRFRFPITVIAVVGLGALVALAVGVSLYLGLSSATENTRRLMALRSETLVEALERRIESQLQPVVHQARWVVDQIERGNVKLDDTQALDTFIRQS